ncbi:MAG: hypothetical protein ACK55I_19790, partial [bacterium]
MDREDTQPRRRLACLCRGPAYISAPFSPGCALSAQVRQGQAGHRGGSRDPGHRARRRRERLRLPDPVGVARRAD